MTNASGAAVTAEIGAVKTTDAIVVEAEDLIEALRLGVAKAAAKAMVAARARVEGEAGVVEVALRRFHGLASTTIHG